ncbi:MAG: hypothetical protein ABIG84_07775 [archaeon]
MVDGVDFTDADDSVSVKEFEKLIDENSIVWLLQGRLKDQKY